MVIAELIPSYVAHMGCVIMLVEPLCVSVDRTSGWIQQAQDALVSFICQTN